VSCFLKNGNNYIKINNDLSNLVEIVIWLNENPLKAEEISSDVQKITDTYLITELILFFEVLKEISESFNIKYLIV
jgi:hypothetical protein